MRVRRRIDQASTRTEIEVRPADYPASWEWRGYNEQLAIITMLTGGPWKPLFASHYAETRMAAALESSLSADLPNPEGAPASSLWLEKA